MFLISNLLTLTLGDASFYIHPYEDEIYMTNPKTVSPYVSVTIYLTYVRKEYII